MEQSTKDQSRMSYQPSLLSLTDAISLPVSGSGITPSSTPYGPAASVSGQDHALASLSPRRGKKKRLPIDDTYGLFGPNLFTKPGRKSSSGSKSHPQKLSARS